MTSPTEQAIIDALRQVREPKTGTDIVSAGMVSGIVVKGEAVTFAIEVDPSQGAALEPMRQAAERAVAALSGVTTVTAVLTAQRSGSPAPKAAAPSGPAPAMPSPRSASGAKPAVPGVRAIVAVASGKGGVGKSTTAVNLALAAAAGGARVGLLDADIYGPSLPRMMGISGKPRATERKTLEPMSNYGIKTMSMGFLVEEDTPMIWRGPMVQSALQQMLREVEWGELDLLVVDLPPGTGDAQLTMAQQVPLAGAVIVSTPQDIALLDARKGLNMFRRVDVPVFGIIENMSYFCCPNCGHRTDIFSHGGARREAERLGVEFLGEIPLDPVIRETSDGGTPIVAAQPDGLHAHAYRAIARRVIEKIAGGPSRSAPRFVVD